MNSKIYSKVSDLKGEVTSHNVGFKKVFLSDKDTFTALTQLSYGELTKDESIDPHFHLSMEEFYYFLSGVGRFSIGNQYFQVEKDVFIRIPSNTEHSLNNVGEQNLRFVYFGLAL